MLQVAGEKIAPRGGGSNRGSSRKSRGTVDPRQGGAEGMCLALPSDQVDPRVSKQDLYDELS